MSAASCLLSEEELLCSICLEVLTDPVSTPCGHNFCKHCITENWRVNTHCRCPCCNEMFPSRPQLKTNIFISAMVAQFKQGAQRDVTQDRCFQHNKPLELFCESDHSCVCVLCSLQHQGHTLVPLKEACEAKQRELQRSQAHTQRMILQRTEKIRQIQQSLELSQKAAEEEAAEGVHYFSAVMEMVQKTLDEVLQEIEEKQRKAKRQAEAVIQGLEEEISELKQRSTKLEQLSRSEDHLHVLKTFPSLTAAPQWDRTNTRIRNPLFLGTVQRAALKIKKQIQSMDPQPLSESQLTKLQQHAVEVTLDPDTAHPELALSADLKQVSHTGIMKEMRLSSKRITGYCGVLGRQSFSSGQNYFEVEVNKASSWVVGIAKQSINRKDYIVAFPANGFWAISLHNGVYCTDEYTQLLLKSVLERVGVFVDYEEGLVCIYDVDTATLLHRFTDCSFTERLYPYFYIHGGDSENSASLIIAPIRSR